MVATFTQDATAYLYWADGAPAARPFGFIPTLLTDDRVTLPTAMRDTAGTFFSLDAAIDPATAPLIASMLRGLLAPHERRGIQPRMVWVALDASGLTASDSQAIALVRGDATGRIAAAISIDMAGYALEIPASATLGINAAGDALVIDGDTAFCTDRRMPDAYPVQQGRVIVPMSGDGAGSLQFAIDLPNGGRVDDDIARLDIGIRFGWRDGKVGVAHQQVDTIVQPAAGTLTLFATIMPYALRDPAVTRFSLLPPSGAAPAIACSYFSPLHGALTLTAAAMPGQRTGGLAFAVQPLVYGAVGDVPMRHYLTLDGAFTIVSATAVAVQLACGLSALEWVNPAAATIAFAPGAAFFDPDPSLGGVPADRLTWLGTTAWVDAAIGAANVPYFAQADASPLFGGTALDGGFLPFVELPVALLSSGTAVPMIGLAGIDPANADARVWLESTIVAPARKAIIDAAGQPPTEASPVDEAITPLGIEATLGTKVSDPWAYVGLATYEGGAVPDIGFYQADRVFQSAVLSGRPFLLLTNAAEVLRHADIHYQLTADLIDRLKKDRPPCFPDPTVLDGVPADMEPLSRKDFITTLPASIQTDDEQLDVLCRLAGTMQIGLEDWTFQLSPDSWPPMPAGEMNATHAKTLRTVMMVKADRKQTVIDWLALPNAWGWPEAAATGDPAGDAATVVQAAIALAQARYDAASDPHASPYRHLLLEVLVDPNWAGVLLFNVAVPVEALPEGLKPLSAGIDKGAFYAHHLGFDASLAEVANGVLSFEKGSAFGAIDYEDTADLVAQDGLDYGFKTLQLTVGFAQSQVTSFAAQVELLIDELFDAQASRLATDRGNNIVLKGVRAETRTDSGQRQYTYHFSTTDTALYQLAGCALQTVEFDAAGMMVNEGLSSADRCVVDFQLNGGLQFWAPGRQPPGSGAPGGFDMFSYGPAPSAAAPADDEGLSGWNGTPADVWVDTPHGRGRLIGAATIDAASPQAPSPAALPLPAVADDPDAVASALRFAKLVIRMTFDPETGARPTFELVIDELALDAASSTPRPDGLASRFPAVPARLLRSTDFADPGSPDPGPSPVTLGYSPADCGVQQAKLGPIWFGIEYELSLGSLGALSGNAEIVLHILAGWCVDPQAVADFPIYLGVKLPGSGPSGFQLPLQGIMQLGFGAMQFDTYDLVPDGSGGLGYLMRLRNFALRVLGKSFPSGHIDVLLVGDPDTPKPTKLGWFASYDAETDPKAVRRPRPTRRFRPLPPHASDAPARSDSA